MATAVNLAIGKHSAIPKIVQDEVGMLVATSKP